MIFKLKTTGDNSFVVYEGAVKPVFEALHWECGNARFMDEKGDQYQIEEVLTPAPPDLSVIARQLVLVVDDHIDSTAKSMGYASIVTAVSYADEPAVPKFQAEGAALRAWRSQCYARLYELQGEAMAGQRPIPTPTELIGLLPNFEPPTL